MSLAEQMADLSRRITAIRRATPSYEWATVATVSPVTVVRDSDATSTPVPVADVQVADLAVDDRVEVRSIGSRRDVIAKAGGIPASRPNLIINGTFRTNQRGYVSGTDLALNAYGPDRWKATTANSRMTFTANANQGQQVTIASGDSWAQDVESSSIDPGQHVLSWEGTAQARVYNVGASAPSYASSPISVTLDGAAHVRVEFGPGTVDRVKLERGIVATPFVLDEINVELMRCMRFYEKTYSQGVAPGTATALNSDYTHGSAAGATTSYLRSGFKFRVTKRTTPTVVVYDMLGSSGMISRHLPGTGANHGNSVTVTDIGDGSFAAYCVGGSATALLAHWTADAEL
jgi:hypothetical protein